jgi:patatin-like phospholipase/acyl hydrolase
MIKSVAVSMLLLGSTVLSAEYYNILSMDGGGIRGIVTARFIQNMEHFGYNYALEKGYISKREVEKINMSEIFDLMAGTSTGSLLTTALAMPAEDGVTNKFTSDSVLDIYRDKGPEVFSKYELPAGWKTFWAAIIALVCGLIFYGIGYRRYHNAIQEKTFKDFASYLDKKEKKAKKAAGILTSLNHEEEEQKDDLTSSMDHLSFDVQGRLGQRLTQVVSDKTELEDDLKNNKVRGVVKAQDALEEMETQYESDKKYKWVVAFIGLLIGIPLGWFGSNLIYIATHSLNDRAGIEKICSHMFGDVPITDALTDEIFIVSFDYEYGNPVFFTKLYASDKSIKNDEDLYSTSLGNASEASAAAPIYFDPKIIHDHILIDGGIIANNPSLYAYEYANKVLKKEKVRVISIGTALGPGNQIDPDTVTLLDWALEIGSLLTTPEQRTHSWVAKYIGEHNGDLDYNRFNYQANKSLSLDMIQPENLNEFQWMGDQIWKDNQEKIEGLMKEMIDQKSASLK